MMKSIFHIIFAAFFLLTSSIGEELVLHLCADTGCASCATESDCCSSESDGCDEQRGCCTELVIQHHFSEADVLTEDELVSVDKDISEPLLLLSRVGTFYFYRGINAQSASPTGTAHFLVPYQEHHLTQRSMLYG